MVHNVSFVFFRFQLVFSMFWACLEGLGFFRDRGRGDSWYQEGRLTRTYACTLRPQVNGQCFFSRWPTQVFSHNSASRARIWTEIGEYHSYKPPGDFWTLQVPPKAHETYDLDTKSTCFAMSCYALLCFVIFWTPSMYRLTIVKSAERCDRRFPSDWRLY